MLLNYGSEALISAFLVLFRAKGETAEEMAGFARAMMRRCEKQGTGSIYSSGWGSADGLEALGVATDLPAEGVKECVEPVGIGHLMSHTYHPAMKILEPVRKKLKIRTIFDTLAPLLNPAQISFAVVSVRKEDMDITSKLRAKYRPNQLADFEKVKKMESALQKNGIRRALVFRSDQGFDEISPLGPAQVLDVTPEKIDQFSFDPLDFGIPHYPIEKLRGGTPNHNAAVLKRMLSGYRGPTADAFVIDLPFLCVLNSAAALFVCGRVSSLADGVALARRTLESGEVLNILNRWRDVSNLVQLLQMIKEINVLIDKLNNGN
ncbi:OLC1v1008031C1 [Oldenlandia corymbosa var. corymbosa]|uniref:OLC1v1008031C1 n=1 Tax=Oldenlandia corymbosa var. corymbosa TaxID=529605 RepID=A0AAV1DN45_OLDCO|nr:OLC1v1008031C1 [Oldenlandia corymbosa var. corymbosa]